MLVDFWFDPACPWCWITSRWMVEVQPQRDLEVRWRPFSLREKNRDHAAKGEDPQYQRIVQPSHRALRVIVAASERYGDAVAGDLYTALGTAIHHDGDKQLEGMAAAIRVAGIDDRDILAAADDPRHDEVIRTSMAEELEAAGTDVGVPAIRIGGAGEPVFFGPVISPMPTGQAALDLYDGLAAISRAGDALWELKRDREGARPQLPERPLLSGGARLG